MVALFYCGGNWLNLRESLRMYPCWRHQINDYDYYNQWFDLLFKIDYLCDCHQCEFSWINVFMNKYDIVWYCASRFSVKMTSICVICASERGNDLYSSDLCSHIICVCFSINFPSSICSMHLEKSAEERSCTIFFEE